MPGAPQPVAAASLPSLELGDLRGQVLLARAPQDSESPGTPRSEPHPCPAAPARPERARCPRHFLSWASTQACTPPQPAPRMMNRPCEHRRGLGLPLHGSPGKDTHGASVPHVLPANTSPTGAAGWAATLGSRGPLTTHRPGPRAPCCSL